MAFSLFGKKPKQPDDVLGPGWQFYSRPNNLEPAGTVFRIDSAGQRFIVTRLAPVVEHGAEPGAAKSERIEASVSILARLLGLPGLGAQLAGGKTRTVRFEITEPVREVTTDEAMDAVLKPWLETLEFRKGNRYFVVREVRSATAMRFDLDRGYVSEAEVQAAQEAVADVEVKVAAKSATELQLTQAFPERLGVMFLAEEIAPTVAALAGGDAALGRTPVNAVLDYVDADFAVVRVHFATDRAMSASEKPSDKFTSGRTELRYGNCDVSLPRDHRMGELEGPSILKLEFRQDPRKHIVLMAVNTQLRDAFFAEVTARVQQSTGSSAFVFIHGYNVSFEDAARRTAQMSYDLGFDGAPVFYSWPSEGKTTSYLVDETNIEWAQPHLENFLREFFERSHAAKVYLIAHSMGNRALTRAVGALLAEKPDLGARLAEIILTAPDIDAQVFKENIAPALIATKRPITLYASSKDLALTASRKVHGYARAGDAGPNLVLLAGIETIDATAVDTSLMGHSYFAESRSVLSDIFYLMRDGRRAAQRFGLNAIDSPGGKYWSFKP